MMNRDHLLYCLRSLHPSAHGDGDMAAGAALAHLFTRLTIHRASQGADTYGEGRWPDRMLPTCIIWIHRADAGGALQADGTLELPGLTAPGAEHYREPFRWDQCLYTFSLVAHSGAPVRDRDCRIMAENTGGRMRKREKEG